MRSILVLASAVAGVSFALPARAQPDILIAKPPVYKLHEEFVGRLTTIDGKTADLAQRTTRGRRGAIHIQTEAILSNDAVLFSSEEDPVTERGVIEQGRDKVRTLESTCTPKRKFPVYIGKEYTCTEKDESAGRVSSSTYHFTYTYAKRDSHGKLVAICGTQTSSEDRSVADKCMTPDGKWIQEITFVEPSSI